MAERNTKQGQGRGRDGRDRKKNVDAGRRVKWPRRYIREIRDGEIWEMERR